MNSCAKCGTVIHICPVSLWGRIVSCEKCGAEFQLRYSLPHLLIMILSFAAVAAFIIFRSSLGLSTLLFSCALIGLVAASLVAAAMAPMKWPFYLRPLNKEKRS